MSDTTAKLPYHGTTLVSFGDAADVTLGCHCGTHCDCDCGWWTPPPSGPIVV